MQVVKLITEDCQDVHFLKEEKMTERRTIKFVVSLCRRTLKTEMPCLSYGSID